MEGSLIQLTRVKPGAHRLRSEVVAHHQRQRIMNAVIEVVAEQGYRGTSVAGIIRRAGISKLKFYENFASKEEAFLAAFDRGVDEGVERTLAAAETAGDDFAARIDRGLAALVEFLVEQPALARACIVEAPSLGPALGARRERAVEAFADLFRGEGTGAGRPAGLSESVLAGLYWLLYEALVSGDSDGIRSVQPALVAFALVPFLGPAALEVGGS